MKLSEWQKQFTAKWEEYLTKLCETGESTASTLFNSATGADGNGGVTVSSERNETGFRIIASGEDAAFIEFGTGVYVNVQRPTIQASFDISSGSWSAEHKGPFSQKGHWYYDGTDYIGTTPLAPMQLACNEMEQRSSEIARSVFR